MIILYSGIGAKKNYIHTEAEFLNIMKKVVTWKDWNKTFFLPIQLQFKNWYLPDDFIFFTLNDWIEYSGAESYDTIEEAAFEVISW
jgi:hypothetical protein